MKRGDEPPVDLGRVRRLRDAEALQDVRGLTVLDALEDLVGVLRELPEGQRPTRLVLLSDRPCLEEVEGAERAAAGGRVEWQRFAGVTLSEVVSMVERAKFDAQLLAAQRDGRL